MTYDTNDQRREWEEKLHAPNISDAERQKIYKLLETVQGMQSPDGLQGSIKKLSRNIIIAIVASILGLGVLIGGLLYGITWYTSSFVEQTVPVPGDATRFDPLASLSAVRSFAGGGSGLLSLDALYIKSDGTMDLMASYKPSATYEFLRETAIPEDAPPVGAGSSPDGKWFEPVTVKVYEPGQWRHVKRMGGGVNTEYSYRNNGMERDISKPVSYPSDKKLLDPACQFSDLWKLAMEHGAPADAVASIKYDQSGYYFYIRDAKISLRFDTKCELMD